MTRCPFFRDTTLRWGPGTSFYTRSNEKVALTVKDRQNCLDAADDPLVPVEALLGSGRLVSRLVPVAAKL